MDDGHIWFELFIIVLLVLGNAVCSLAEIAIVGARKTKLQELADEGKRGAAQALKLTGRKEELFSTIQVGITTISIVTGMFSGASLAGPLADFLGGIPIAGAFLAPLSMFFVMALVTYFALIIGELAPKWIAIAEPEKAACLIARPMIYFPTCASLLWYSARGQRSLWWRCSASAWGAKRPYRKRKYVSFSIRGRSSARLTKKNRK